MRYIWLFWLLVLLGLISPTKPRSSAVPENPTGPYHVEVWSAK